MAKVVQDYLIGTPLLHDHTPEYDARYVNVTGDTMTGELTMGTNAIVLEDSAGVEWKLTVNTDGALVTTEVVPILPLEGNPIGLLLTLTYAADQ